MKLVLVLLAHAVLLESALASVAKWGSFGAASHVSASSRNLRAGQPGQSNAKKTASVNTPASVNTVTTEASASCPEWCAQEIEYLQQEAPEEVASLCGPPRDPNEQTCAGCDGLCGSFTAQDTSEAQAQVADTSDGKNVCVPQTDQATCEATVHDHGKDLNCIWCVPITGAKKCKKQADMCPNIDNAADADIQNVQQAKIAKIDSTPQITLDAPQASAINSDSATLGLSSGAPANLRQYFNNFCTGRYVAMTLSLGIMTQLNLPTRSPPITCNKLETRNAGFVLQSCAGSEAIGCPHDCQGCREDLVKHFELNVCNKGWLLVEGTAEEDCTTTHEHCASVDMVDLGLARWCDKWPSLAEVNSTA